MHFPDLSQGHDSDRAFSEKLIRWQKQHGRHSLPWQKTRDPYRIWLSEIMLQQTQVATVIPYYQRFLARFPDVATLASAPLQAVMELWSGLGYYSRARNLHLCAQRVFAEYRGIFPADPALLEQLPGIGRSTAAAIAAFSCGVRAAILDGNVIRVFSRIFGIAEFSGGKPVKDALWRRAEALLPVSEIESYTQGLMDLGATICTRSKPNCPSCPFASCCVALASDRVEELPVRKPKKTLPEKRTAMLVIIHENQVLLEQRPDFGVWGGLLSLPELAVQQDSAEEADQHALELAAASYGIVQSCRQLQSFVHVFSHFRLHVSPYRISISQRLKIAAQSKHVWYEFDRIDQAPLPSPVKKLLLGMANLASLD